MLSFRPVSPLALCFLVLPLAASAETPAAPQPRPAAVGRLAATYGKLPLSFEANQGQTDKSVQYLAHGQGYTLFLRPDEAVLTLNPANTAKPGRDLARFGSARSLPLAGQNKAGLRNAALDNTSLEKPDPPSIVRMQLVGANPHPTASEFEPQITRTNYFIGNDPRKWHTNIPNYARVKYAGIYPGIDLVYYGNQRQLEHDFVVAPGADPTQIVLHLAGSTPHIDPKTGDLILKTSTGELHLNKPVTYQQINGQRHEIPSTYKLLPANKVGFQIAAYNHAAQLTIDPILIYSTYLGGSTADVCSAIAVDSAGDAYIAGDTGSTDFPLANPYQSTMPENNGSATVSEFNADGSALIFSTYLGGSEPSYTSSLSIALDRQRNIYVTGETSSTTFPTHNALQPHASGSSPFGNAFVTEFKAGGESLVYSTYLNGSIYSEATGIAVDTAGNAFVAGTTNSTDFPTKDAFQASLKGTHSAFLTEYASGGQSLVFSTYLGGTETDSYDFQVTASVAIDSSNDVYVAGTTRSTDFPTKNAYQSTLKGGSDAFVTEFEAGGQSLVYSTYLGGTLDDKSLAVAVDSSGNAYIVGTTGSGDFPTANALQTGQAYVNNAFVTEVSSGGGSLVFSTYLLGTLDATGVAVDSSGHAYVAGYTYDTGLTTVNAIQNHSNAPYGSDNAFVTEFATGGQALIYSTYLGGTFYDGANEIAIDSAGNAYITGITADTDFPTVDPFQSMNKAQPGHVTGFVAKISAQPDGSQVAAPLFIPPAGTYPALQTISLADATPGASIYYTVTYGSKPTTSSTLYTGPFTMAGVGSVAAIAAAPGLTTSPSVYAYYGLRVNQPSFTAKAGMYNQTETVTIADITPGAAIHYTLSGSTPTATSPLYTAPIQVTTPETITAIGVLAGFQNSTINSASYSPPAAAPVVSPATATYYAPPMVSITSATPGAKIYYTTTHGATPTTSSTLYTGPFTVNTSETVAAIATAPGFANSLTGSSYYGLRVNEPTFDHAGITYSGPIMLAIADPTPSATIYYTTPSASSTKYTGPISITSSERIEAIALLPGYEPSSVMNAYFTIH